MTLKILTACSISKFREIYSSMNRQGHSVHFRNSGSILLCHGKKEFTKAFNMKL